MKKEPGFCTYCSWSIGSCSTTVTQYDVPWREPNYYIETICSDGTHFEQHKSGYWNGECESGFVECPAVAIIQQ